MQLDSEPEVNASPDLQALNKLIQRWIAKAKLQSHPTLLTAKISELPSLKKF